MSDRNEIKSARSGPESGWLKFRAGEDPCVYLKVSERFITTALASRQTEFESVGKMSDETNHDSIIFVTVVPGAPLQVVGRLGCDGKWYVKGWDPPGARSVAKIRAEGYLLLTTEPIADAIIHRGIKEKLADLWCEAIDARTDSAKQSEWQDFRQRLAASRFSVALEWHEGEIQKALGKLAAAGLVYDSGERRDGEIVWKPTPGKEAERRWFLES